MSQDWAHSRRPAGIKNCNQLFSRLLRESLTSLSIAPAPNREKSGLHFLLPIVPIARLRAYGNFASGNRALIGCLVNRECLKKILHRARMYACASYAIYSICKNLFSHSVVLESEARLCNGELHTDASVRVYRVLQTSSTSVLTPSSACRTYKHVDIQAEPEARGALAVPSE